MSVFNRYWEEMQGHYVRGKWAAVHTVRDANEDITSGNHHVIGAVHHKFLALMDQIRLRDISQAVTFIESTRDVTGVFNRAATKLEDQAHDDILALVVSDFYLDRGYARELYAIGDRWVAGWMRVWKIKVPVIFKWYFDNTEETPEIELKKWFGRFMWLPGVIKICTRRPDLKMSWFEKLNYMIYLGTNLLEKDPNAMSGRQLRWLTIDVVYRQGYPMVNRMIRKWRQKQEETYGLPIPGDPFSGWNKAMGIFHGPTNGVIHPFAEFANSVWVLECRKTK